MTHLCSLPLTEDWDSSAQRAAVQSYSRPIAQRHWSIQSQPITLSTRCMIRQDVGDTLRIIYVPVQCILRRCQPDLGPCTKTSRTSVPRD